MTEAAPAPVTGFPPASEAEWKNLVERALGGRPFESLISTTFDGLKIEPLYPRVTGESPRALRQKPGPWKISQRMDHPDIETANAMARADLEGGADALTLTVSQAPSARAFGVPIESERELDAVLAGIDLDLIPLRLDAGPRAQNLAPFFAAIAQKRRLTSAALDIDIGFDPVGLLARTGAMPPVQGMAQLHKLLRGSGFAGHLLLADGRPYHEAGGGDAQELACVIATGVEYLRLLEREGLPLDEARAEIAFLLAADADEFLSLAKFRALRLLWARIESACGLALKPIRLHGETSFRMMTRFDPWTNIFRTTLAAFAAGLGGADSVTVLPFTLALGLPDEFARRIARNTQLILIHEAKLAKVADPAAGAGSFEALTSELCERAWHLLQEFEAQGGMIASLRAGVPQRAIAAAAAARREAIAHRRLAITGTSTFPLLGETPINVLRAAPLEAHETAAGQDCPLLASCRDAEPYERLRTVSDVEHTTTGERPKIFLAGLGRPQDHAAASAFAANFFASAGIEALRGKDLAPAPEAAFRASGARIACICAARTVPAHALIEAAHALRTAGAMRVYVIGNIAQETAAASRQAGISESVCAGSDALAILSDALVVARGKRQR
jgi:methylmalonyl-CoA mutase